eukprot:1148892-Pelagomonas_calceolata.AAC.8
MSWLIVWRPHFRLFKCTHSGSLHLIGTILALECSLRYYLPEHMLRFVQVALCALIDWATAHMGHWVVRYGVLVVKTRLHAAAN